jgi:hypothetical protein
MVVKVDVEKIGCVSATRRAHVCLKNGSEEMFDRGERVRLTRQESGVPAGTEGIVAGPFKEHANVWMMQFAGYGMHEAPMQSLERVDGPELRLSAS